MKISNRTLIREVDKCRVCGSSELEEVLSLGEQYVTDFVAEDTRRGLRGPLVLVMCDKAKGGCGLIQLKHTFNHDALYRQYWYKSGISVTMVKALADIVTKAETLIKLNAGDIVLDIGANDGTLLKQYVNKKLMKVGFEPSNLWELALQENTKIMHDYFGYKSFAKEFGRKKAKIITSIAMFYDLDDPNSFVSDVKRCLAKDGVWIVQMNYLGLMLENNTFDNISHEHLEYYSLKTLETLLKKHHLEAFDIEINDVNGGSFRVYIRHIGSSLKGSQGSNERIQKQRHYEIVKRLDEKETYLEFARRISIIKKNLNTFLQTENAKGKKIFVYGASTRGSVVLQFAQIDYPLIKAATDKNPDKWGKYIVGTRIKIVPLEEYRKERPDYLFVLPYQFISEIKDQEKSFAENGGKFVVSIPKVTIIL